ncbi:hypothetical protein G4G27_14865 [Sphingomonas sp. So64.6b]|uniref:hypothetical protein n=1 Tax=Sphingomonas sp. So64.6b TaxID=2997354 RepID=UPI0016019713|nr:hypothetical protein [Sphingomonas sp. So64.6b]QNA85133.1 hypothetical protein G4G27_14865 [Sphingomonas sp. So64.6b]
MTFWAFLDRCLDRLPGWPSERQWVTIGAFALAALLLGMAMHEPALWEVEVFKVIIQAVTLTGLLNMIFAFHFAANKGDEDKTRNTAAAFAAITATAQAGNTPAPTPDVMLRPGETAQKEDRP